MNRTSLRWLAGAALAGLATTTLVTPPSAAPAPATSFWADGSTPMIGQEEAQDLFEQDPTAGVTGLTVVRGTTPVPFTGTYDGYLPDALGKGAGMFLFRLEGAGIDAASNPLGRPSGIWAGMSGSPVYTADGRLIGAVAYGLSADDIPIAGVTPADVMQRAGTDHVQAPASVRTTTKTLRKAGSSITGGTTFRQLKSVKVMTGGHRANAVLNRTQARVPSRSPLAATARSQDFAPVGAPTRIAQPLVPGGNIAVGYSTGDLFSGGVGTVTAVCGNSVWAFGHPMDFLGETSLSMHNASAARVVPDSTGLTGAYKQVATVGEQIGTITQDRWSAIRGEVGLIRGFPAVTSVRDARGRLLATYRGTVVNEWMATNAAMGPVRGAVDLLDNVGIGTARLSWRIDYRLANGRTGQLRNSQIYAGFGALADDLATDLGGDLEALAGTDLADVTVTGVTSTLTLLNEKSVAYRFAGSQVRVGKKWVKLSGRTLKKNRTHTVRPLLRQYVNGKPKALVPGPASTFTMGRLAKGRGSVTFSPRGAQQQCIQIDGEKICAFGEDEEQGARSFSELLGQRDALVPADRATAVAQWSWKAKKSTGVRQKTSRLVAPGVVSGTHRTTFRIAR